MTDSNGCALVVTFHPPPAVRAEIAAIRTQCRWVFVIDNGSAAEELAALQSLAAESDNVELIRNPDNIGLASALNQGCRLAKERGFDWVLFLDQDTEPLPDMVAILLAAWQSHPAPQRVGTIGSNHYDERGRPVHERVSGPPYRTMPFVITSGSIAPLRVFEDVGPFRDDFFIDFIDIEFGYRLTCRGLESLLCLEPTMKHMWGAPYRFKVFGLDLMVSNHSALRRYFIVRNGAYVMTRYWLRFPLRCSISFARMSIGAFVLLFLENKKWQKAKAMFIGYWHGLFGRLGPISRSGFLA